MNKFKHHTTTNFVGQGWLCTGKKCEIIINNNNQLPHWNAIGSL